MTNIIRSHSRYSLPQSRLWNQLMKIGSYFVRANRSHNLLMRFSLSSSLKRSSIPPDSYRDPIFQSSNLPFFHFSTLRLFDSSTSSLFHYSIIPVFQHSSITRSHCPSLKPARETFCSLCSQNGSNIFPKFFTFLLNLPGYRKYQYNEF